MHIDIYMYVCIYIIDICVRAVGWWRVTAGRFAPFLVRDLIKSFGNGLADQVLARGKFHPKFLRPPPPQSPEPAALRRKGAHSRSTLLRRKLA